MSHYFTNDNLKSDIKSYKTKVLGKEFTFNTDNGVFCKDYLDYGTRVLLESIPTDKIKGKALDVGCGYGVIGIVLAKVLNINVDMVDVNRRALHLAKMNIKENGISNVNVFESNVYDNVKDKYDVIITNPPIRAGKKIVYDIIFGAFEHLNKDGILLFVIRKDQGAKSLISDLSLKYNVEVINKSKGFFIISATFN